MTTPTLTKTLIDLETTSTCTNSNITTTTFRTESENEKTTPNNDVQYSQTFLILFAVLIPTSLLAIFSFLTFILFKKGFFKKLNKVNNTKI